MTNTGEVLILIVEDDKDMRSVLRRYLQKHGYLVSEAINGYEALDQIEKEQYDLVLLDILMPGMSGLDVLRAIREKHNSADLPVVMATAVGESKDIVRAFELGANDYVTKPFDMTVVMARVSSQLSLRRLSVLKDEFIRIASHNLKNPLTVVSGLAQILQRRFANDSETLTFLSKIINRTSEMQHIVEDFLDFEALQDGQITLKKQAVNLNEIALEVIESNREYAAEKLIHLESDFDHKLPPTQADREHISQVIRNLVSNAIKFSPPGAPGARAKVRTRKER